MLRKTLIIEASFDDVKPHLDKVLRRPLVSIVGRLVCIQDGVIDELGDDALRSIALAFSIPLRAIRQLEEFPTESRGGQVLAITQRAAG